MKLQTILELERFICPRQDGGVTGVEIFCEGLVCKFAPLAQNEDGDMHIKW